MSIIERLLRIILPSPCERDRRYLSERVETLTHQLSQGIRPIPIVELPVTTISPYMIRGCDIVAADSEYLTYTFDDWRAMLTRLHDGLKDNYKWTKDIWDCDDVALLYSAVLSYSAYKVGIRTQPAFAIAWSGKHAYNVFVDSNNIVHIYEPQTDTVVAALGKGKDKDVMYDTKRIWFMS